MNNSIRSEWLARYAGKTQKQAKTSLNAFDVFIKEKYFDNEDNFIAKCKIGDESNLYLQLDDLVIFWNNKGFSSVTIRNYFTFIRAYLRRHGIKTNSAEIKDYVKFPKKIKETKKALTKEIIKKILDVCDLKHKAFYLFLSCTGMRLEEAIEARVSWLDLTYLSNYKLVIVNIPAVNTKGKTERFTFLTNEVYQVCKPYLENRISPNEKIFDFSYGSIEEYMQHIRRKLGFNEKYVTGFYKLNNHSFRSFTRTILSNSTNTDFAYFILGQDNYLNEYYRGDIQECLKLYKRAERELKIVV